MPEPCFFFNTGGCFHYNGSIKKPSECPFDHIKVDHPLEKPQQYRPPCKYYHLRGFCSNSECIFGHVEIASYKWNRYFNIDYPGYGYTQNCGWVGKSPIKIKSQNEKIKEVKTTILMILFNLLD
jgi:hypothetical protein